MFLGLFTENELQVLGLYQTAPGLQHCVLFENEKDVDVSTSDNSLDGSQSDSPTVCPRVEGFFKKKLAKCVDFGVHFCWLTPTRWGWVTVTGIWKYLPLMSNNGFVCIEPETHCIVGANNKGTHRCRNFWKTHRYNEDVWEDVSALQWPHSVQAIRRPHGHVAFSASFSASNLFFKNRDFTPF